MERPERNDLFATRPHLAAGTLYNIELHYYEHQGDASVPIALELPWTVDSNHPIESALSVNGTLEIGSSRGVLDSLCTLTKIGRVVEALVPSACGFRWEIVPSDPTKHPFRLVFYTA